MPPAATAWGSNASDSGLHGQTKYAPGFLLSIENAGWVRFYSTEACHSSSPCKAAVVFRYFSEDKKNPSTKRWRGFCMVTRTGIEPMLPP